MLDPCDPQSIIDNFPSPQSSGQVGNPSVVAAAISRWGLTSLSDKVRAGIIGVLLSNQEQYHRRILEDGDTSLQTALIRILGSNWNQIIYDGITYAWSRHPLADMFGVQPLTMPIGAVAYFKQRYSSPQPNSGEAPEVHLSIDMTECVAKSGSPGALLIGEHADDDTRTDIVRCLFEESLNSIAQEILATMLNGAPGFTTFPGELPIDSVRRASSMVFRATMQGPANNLVANAKALAKLGVTTGPSSGLMSKVAVLEGKWSSYLDPMFPDNEVLMWYQGPSLLSTGIVYSPYEHRFSVSEGEANKLGHVHRYGVKLVNPSNIIKLTL